MNNTVDNTTTLQTKVEDAVKSEFVSPYQLIKILNEVGEFNLPTQMGYNYTKKGLIKTSKNTTGKLQVSKTDAVEWIVKYITKKTNTTTNEE